MTRAERNAMSAMANSVVALFEAMQQAMPVLARLGIDDDEAWGAYTHIVHALDVIGRENIAVVTETVQ